MLLAAQDMSLAQLVQFLVAGLVVVMVTLALLALFCMAMGAVFQRVKAGPQPSAAPASADSKQAVPDEVAVAIAAAVAVAIGQSHRIAHIGQATDDAWAMEGRMQHHASHAVRRRGS